MPDPRDFFISYNKADRRWAEWIAWQLEENGYTITIQAWHAQTGKNFIAWMNEASIHCARTLALLSDAYFTGPFSEKEWTAAFAEDKLLPVLIQDINVQGLLSAISYIDLVGKEEAEVLAVLLDAVRPRAKPDTPPVFPGKIPHTVDQPTSFPGSLPPIWNVLHRRNPHFTGREAVLDALHDALRSGRPAALTQALSGLGGVGKTQLAIEYAYRYRADYGLVWWIRSEETTTLAGAYAALAQKLDLPEKDAQEQDIVIRAVRQRLAQSKDWLLIFDNATSKKTVYPYLPQGEGGHVVITSRNRDWGGVADPLPVYTWPRDESVAFLLARVGGDDAEGADQVAGALGDLPLALEQAGAYIAQSSLSFGAYRDLFETRRRDLWHEEAAPLAYPHTVATTWSLAMDRVAEEAAVGRDILNFCAFLAPDDIPRSFLEHLPEHLPEDRGTAFGDALAINRGIQALSRYSLMEATPERLAVHRLVQAVAHDRLAQAAKEEAAMWAEAALGLVDQAWPQGTFDAFAWPACERLMPHSSACMQHVDTFEVVTEGMASLANRMGFYLQGRASYAEAEPLYRRALEGRERVLGPDHPSTLLSVNNLGFLLQARGDLEGAEPLYRRALEGRERVLGPDHPSTLLSVNNLGGLLQVRGDLEGAEPLYRRALEGRERVLGPDHPSTLLSVNNLGYLLQARGDLDGAEPLYRRALEGSERVLGPDHPSTLLSVNNLGYLLQARGDLEGAEPLYRRALEGSERVLGPNHPDTLGSVNNLGYLLYARGDLEGAEPLYRRALEGRERVLGPNHPDTLGSVNNLGYLLQARGDLEGAEPLYRRALEGLEKLLGSAHPTTKIVRGNLMRILEQLGRPEA